MKTDRQEYRDISIEDALAAKFDIVELKYDGWWCRMEIADDGTFNMYSRTERILRSGQVNPALAGTYIGEFMFGTNWAQQPEYKDKFFMFDCWKRKDVDLQFLGYRERAKYLLTAGQFPEWCQNVAIYQATRGQELWDTEVILGNFEGLVWRRFGESVADVVYRTKKTVTDEYIITGIIEGEPGKFEGMVGTLVCKTQKGAEARVGGGLSTPLRQAIWDNPTAYIGKLIEVQGKARFEETGLLRHPNFIRFKDV